MPSPDYPSEIENLEGNIEFKVIEENLIDIVAYFPLAEGQKLMQGDCIDNAGIHHKRAQIIFDGSEDETWNMTDGGATSPTNKYFNNASTDNIAKDNSIIVCNRFQKQTIWATDNIGINYEGTATLKSFRIRCSETSVANFRTWLSNNPVVVEYLLPEEELTPFTVDQQEAWNNIKNITLFEGVNHISSDANMVLKYYPLEPVGLKFILRIDIENKQETTEIIDTTLPEVTDYNKIYEADVTAKVQVYVREDGSEYNLYLKTDRTTTTNKDDPDRASGKIEVISVETADRAEEEALNVMKGNNYKHLVEFKIAKTSKLMDITQLHIGKPIRIKTDDDIYDSYISAITLSDENFVYFKSGSLRITLLDKLKSNKNDVGNKFDVSGGIINGNVKVIGEIYKGNSPIIQQGTNYIKFYDGTLITKQIKTVDTYISNSWGNLYISPDITLDDYPITFIEIPTVTISVDSGYSAIIMNAGKGSKTKPPKVNLARGESLSSSNNFDIHVIAIGNWK